MTAIRAIARPSQPRHPARPSHIRPVRSLAPRTVLFHEGDAAGHLYEVVSGTLRQTRVLETGRRQVVAFAHAGDVVGFPAGGLHHAECEALTDVTVIAHARSVLDDPEADVALHRRLQLSALSEIAHLQDHLLLLARKGAAGKLASFLGELADRMGTAAPGGIALEPEMSRTDIADYLCLTIETVSRTLTRMCADGIIARDGTTRLLIADRDRLDAMARAE